MKPQKIVFEDSIDRRTNILKLLFLYIKQIPLNMSKNSKIKIPKRDFKIDG
jgi:hypothetical protein